MSGDKLENKNAKWKWKFDVYFHVCKFSLSFSNKTWKYKKI